MTASLTTSALLAEALGIAEGEITPDIGLETCAQWDSMAHFRIVAAVEETLGRALTPSEIFDMSGYQSVDTLLTERSEA